MFYLLLYRDYYMAIFISYPVSTRDSHISPRLPYQPEGRRLVTHHWLYWPSFSVDVKRRLNKVSMLSVFFKMAYVHVNEDYFKVKLNLFNNYTQRFARKRVQHAFEERIDNHLSRVMRKPTFWFQTKSDTN